MTKIDYQTLRGDISGGVTATFVALPVALALGVASGMGAAAGMYGAIAVGFFAAVFGGTRTRISGPTAPMTVAFVVIVSIYTSNLTEALTVVVMAGLLQVLLGLSRIGRFVAYTPRVVISAFMSGIGIIIMVIHILPVLGSALAPGGVIGTTRAVCEAVENVNYNAVAIAVVALVVGVVWPRRLARYLPGPLLSLAAGTMLGVFWLTNVPVIGRIPNGLPDLRLTVPSVSFLVHALVPALILALLGSVDSLQTSLVADSYKGTRHNPSRELVGQGVGNMVSGLFGGLPGAGSRTGTVTNIRAGGETPVSGALYAILMLGLLLGLGRYVVPIPHAVLAGILMKVGWDIVDWRLLARVHRLRREHLLVMLITLGLTVFVDLVTAVAIGLIVAGMVHARQLERLALDSVVSVPLLDRTFFSGEEDIDVAAFSPDSARVGQVELGGSLTVASSHKLASVIGAEIKDHEVVILDFSGATYLDDTAARVIGQLMDIARSEKAECIVMGLSGLVPRTLNALGILKHVPRHRIVDTMDEARQAARGVLGI
ncbi:MAG: SulP family inorganic anion transporter [Gemmatimonadetes bacterium]|nr:SulP family inorganic anion transporter [Gemmatimonadota bacterium]